MKKLTSILLAFLLVLSLPCGASAAETVESVREMVDALPSVEEFQAMEKDAQVDAYNRTQYAYDAYMALPTAEEKAQIEGAEETFDALFSYYNTLIMPLEDSGKEDSNALVWIVLAVMAAIVIVPMYQKKKTA